jgi:hypothetical protein
MKSPVSPIRSPIWGGLSIDHFLDVKELEKRFGDKKLNLKDGHKNQRGQGILCSLLCSPICLPSLDLGWRPVTLRWFFLGTIAIISGALFAVIQSLHSKSQSNNGLLFAASINDLPWTSTFCYTHLPTIIFVLYSLLWIWVDLDIRRLEPFFQLSKPNGAKGSDSLLLTYPVDFVLEVPYKAARKRQVLHSIDCFPD